MLGLPRREVGRRGRRALGEVDVVDRLQRVEVVEDGANLVEALVMLLLAAGVFNTIFVSVMERRRELGVLRALGFSPSELFTLITWESLWIAAVGLVTAAVVTAGLFRCAIVRARAGGGG